jgi:hypothetical protein
MSAEFFTCIDNISHPGNLKVPAPPKPTSREVNPFKHMSIFKSFAGESHHVDIEHEKLVITSHGTRRLIDVEDITQVFLQCRVGYDNTESCCMSCVLSNSEIVKVPDLPKEKAETLMIKFTSHGVQIRELPKLLASDFPLLPDLLVPTWVGGAILAAAAAIAVLLISQLAG